MNRYDSKKILMFSFVYCLFIIYGSLVPLDYQPKPFEAAWQSFKHIRYLNLGAASRADWIANIILYIPLTFSLAAYAINNKKSSIQIILIASTILLGSLCLAILIEFFQQFFPPRTVSQNDLIAETIGSLIGLIIWFSYGKRILELHRFITSGGKKAFLASAILYTTGYLLISFFPYDFVTSFQELHDKLSRGNDAFLLSPGCGGVIRCTARLSSEVLLTIPLGIFLSVILKWHPKRSTAVMLIGFVFATLIEVIQLFLVSGIAQGLSIVTRVTGMGLGEKIYTLISQQKRLVIPIATRKYITIGFFPYLLALAGINGWSLSNKLADNPLEKLTSIHWLPFYYHYYTTETIALTSLLSVFFMYMPIGLGLWLWNKASITDKRQSKNITAGFLAMSLSLIIETSKLFLTDKHPDPTNLLISFASAYLTYSLCTLMAQWFYHPEPQKQHPHDAIDANQAEPLKKEIKHKQSWQKIIAVIASIVLIWKLVDYPLNPLPLTAGLLIFAVLLYKYPQSWLIALPALLPVLDFSPWTGRIYFSEFDYFILTTLGINYWFGKTISPVKVFAPIAILLSGLYLFFYAISLFKGLMPLQPLDINAFINYYSHYNSLRVSQGMLWFVLLLPILSYSLYHQKNTLHFFSYGMLTGLAITSLIAIRERLMFTGLFDFDSDYRITASFYSMHTGGAPLDAYLLIGIPFIYILLADEKHQIRNSILALVLFTLSLYTLLMTFSRGTYIAFAAEAFLIFIGLLVCYKKQRHNNWKKSLWLLIFLILSATISTPILEGSFIQYRFKQADKDADIRSSHWRNAIAMMDSSLTSTLFGMGLGSFPRNYYWNSFDEQNPSNFTLQHEKNTTYLQIRGGSPLFIEQSIEAYADTDYQLTLNYRAYSKPAGFSIQLCEKAILYSFNCQIINIDAALPGQWQHFEKTINTRNIGKPKYDFPMHLLSKPVKLLIYNGDKDTVIDVKNITLLSPESHNLIKNSDFSANMDHWFFTADDHTAWHTKNLWVQILFEQGWPGLLSFTLLLLAAVISLYLKISQHQLLAIVLLSSLSGFMILSIIDSTFDTPKITLLFFMLLFLSFSKINTPINKGNTL